MCCVEEWVNFKMSLASYIYNTLSKYLHHTLQYQQKNRFFRELLLFKIWIFTQNSNLYIIHSVVKL